MYKFLNISGLDFSRFYSRKTRVLLHLAMWLFFAVLLFLNYYLEFSMDWDSALFLTLRATVANMVAFYIFFYLLPGIFHAKSWLVNIILLVLSFMLIIILWLLVNHFQLLLLHWIGFEVQEGPFKGVIVSNSKRSLKDVLSVKSIFGNANMVMFSFMPPFFAKIMFDITRLYSRTLQIEKQRAELEIKNINIEKDFLKSQLNPHFLFNTLNNLYGLSKKRDSSAPDIILNLSDVMAYTLYNSGTEKVDLEKELGFISNYFSLEKMRHSTDKNISLNIIRNYDKRLFIAPLIAFTFIENAFKYGLKTVENPFVNINIDIRGNVFHFEIKNDKNKFSPENSDNENRGIGIENARRRLQLLYPDKHTLNIQNAKNFYQVNMEIILE